MFKSPSFVRRKIIMAAAGLVSAAACIAPTAFAKSDYPERPVRLIIPFSAGGATDAIGRAVADQLGKAWGQSVVVENRPGAGGIVGANSVVGAQPDGYTLLLASSSMFTVNPHLYKDLPYGVQDFRMIGGVAEGPMVVAVNNDLPVKNLQELIDYAKKHPKQLNFGSAGVGSQTHLAGEAFADAAGFDMTHVPYKGEGPAFADLMAGQIDFVVANIGGVSPLVSSGRVRGLAVTGKEKSPMLPDLPTVDSAGVPGFSQKGWFALMAPAKTPVEITDKIHAGLAKVLAQPDTQQMLAQQGNAAAPTSSTQLVANIDTESTNWSAIIKRRGLQAQ